MGGKGGKATSDDTAFWGFSLGMSWEARSDPTAGYVEGIIPTCLVHTRCACIAGVGNGECGL